MKLIDADKLTEVIMRVKLNSKGAPNFATAEVIDAVEVVHGEWIDKGWKGDWEFETGGRGNCWHEYECSECGFHKKGGKSNYCPNCGARMKGADDE